MIDLRTGTPGSGKTLSMVQALAKLIDRWKTHPDEARPIFVLGIPDLALPHSELPLKSVSIGKNSAPRLVPDWDALPDGALVLIDEAQGVFPPRSPAMEAPEHVSFLNVHRHRGFDIWLTTQHPRLIDHGVRALVGKHMHYRRMFGGMRAVVYEWDACSDSLAGTKNAVTSYWSYPRKVFDWYKSAEVHTKQKFKLPVFIWIPFIGLALAAYFFPNAYQVIFNGVKGKPLKEASAPAPEKSGSILPTAQVPLPTARQPLPVATVSQPSPPQFVGCMASAARCSCVTPAGEIVDNPPSCRESSESFGHLIRIALPPPSSPAPSVAAPVPPSAPATESAPSHVATLPQDGFGVLGKAGEGVRQPGY